MLGIVNGIADFMAVLKEEANTLKRDKYFLGKIIKIKPEVSIKYNDIMLDSKQILYTSWAKNLMSGMSTTVSSQHSHSVNVSSFKIGDTVLLYEMDDKVLIIDKVVV